MNTLMLNGEEYALSDVEAGKYIDLIETGVDETTALQIATGDFNDLQPPAEEWDG